MAVIPGIQNDDFKTKADLISLGSTAAHLLNITNIWDTVNNQTLDVTIAGMSGGGGRTTNTVTTNFTIPTLSKDYLLNVNSTSGVVAIVLPDATASAQWCATIKNTGSPASAVTITAFGGQTIDSASSFVNNFSKESENFCAVGGSWFIY